MDKCVTERKHEGRMKSRANTIDKCVRLRAEARMADEERAGPLPGRATGAKNADAFAHRAMKRITLRIPLMCTSSVISFFPMSRQELSSNLRG
jgi:hypothetical protein